MNTLLFVPSAKFTMPVEFLVQCSMSFDEESSTVTHGSLNTFLSSLLPLFSSSSLLCLPLLPMSRVSLILQTSHCLLRNGTLAADTYELGLQFDKHRIVTLENVKAVFPREGGEGISERRKMKRIEQEVNSAM